MLQETTIENFDNLLYPALSEAWNAIESVSRKREILNKLGITSVHLWRLLKKKKGEEPMREAYLNILKQELIDVAES